MNSYLCQPEKTASTLDSQSTEKIHQLGVDLNLECTDQKEHEQKQIRPNPGIESHASIPYLMNPNADWLRLSPPKNENTIYLNPPFPAPPC